MAERVVPSREDDGLAVDGIRNPVSDGVLREGPRELGDHERRVPSVGMGTPPVSRTSATPMSDTVTERSRSSPGGTKLRSTSPRSRRDGPWSSASTSAVASWSPRGTKTGSGTMMLGGGVEVVERDPSVGLAEPRLRHDQRVGGVVDAPLPVLPLHGEAPAPGPRRASGPRHEPPLSMLVGAVELHGHPVAALGQRRGGVGDRAAAPAATSPPPARGEELLGGVGLQRDRGLRVQEALDDVGRRLAGAWAAAGRCSSRAPRRGRPSVSARRPGPRRGCRRSRRPAARGTPGRRRARAGVPSPCGAGSSRHRLRGVARGPAAAGCAAARRRRAAAGSAGTGRPRPGRPQACSQPPWRWVSSSAIDRPSPVPPLVRARAGSARQNRLNTMADSPTPRPTPWSRTAIAAAWSSPATRITMSPLSAWSIALVTRLRTIRSTRRTSASARQGWSGASTIGRGQSFWRASAAVASTIRWATSTRSTSSISSTAAPASKRLISSRSTSSALEPVELGLQQLRGAGRWPGRSRARASWSTSPAIRTVVSGVRSSWETSATNRRCTRDSSSSCRIWRCRLVAIWLKDVASRARSSSPETRSRSCSWPAASRSATRRAIRTGVTTCRVTSQVSPGHEQHQQPGRGEHRARESRPRVADLVVEREEVVERVGLRVGRQLDLRADDDRRARRCASRRLDGAADSV